MLTLTEEAIKKINESLERGFDVEIQRQKNGVKILKYHREVFYKTQNDKSNGDSVAEK